jgi:hypothetical protein
MKVPPLHISVDLTASIECHPDHVVGIAEAMADAVDAYMEGNPAALTPDVLHLKTRVLSRSEGMAHVRISVDR